eukprot:9735086-Lingulodinium_polyedra.AAC.1
MRGLEGGCPMVLLPRCPLLSAENAGRRRRGAGLWQRPYVVLWHHISGPPWSPWPTPSLPGSEWAPRSC